MKLRLAKNSVRLRVLRSEVQALQRGERLTEAVCFGPDTALTYTLEGRAAVDGVAVQFAANEVSVRVGAERLQQWAEGDEVGIYERLDVGLGRALEVLLEKDFACLDRSDAENADTFANPNASC